MSEPFLLTDELKASVRHLQAEKMQQYRRRVSVGDLLTDRHENAKVYGWGDGTTCYDNVLVIGDVRVGRNTWIGPNVVLDGSGDGLEIGDFCSIAAGVQIYTHHTVKWANSMGKEAVEKAPTKIGSGVYIGPNAVISKGVTIGDRATIGAMSLVNSNIPIGVKAWGCPARIDISQSHFPPTKEENDWRGAYAVVAATMVLMLAFGLMVRL